MQNSIISGNHNSGFITNIFNMLTKPGDSFSARVTPNNRQVIKACSDGVKMSATRYPNGTIVETRTIRPR